MRHDEILIHRVATDNRPEEVVVILTIQQGSEIGDTIFSNDAERKTRGRGTAGVAKWRNLNTSWRTGFADKPVDAGAGERRVHAGAIELDGPGWVAAVKIAGEQQGLFDAFGKQAKRMRIRIRA